MTQQFPDDVPRSPTGRIPKWVMDEAVGNPVDAPGFRTYGAQDPHHHAPGRKRSRSRRLWMVVAAILTLTLAAAAVIAVTSRGPYEQPGLVTHAFATPSVDTGQAPTPADHD